MRRRNADRFVAQAPDIDDQKKRSCRDERHRGRRYGRSDRFE